MVKKKKAAKPRKQKLLRKDVLKLIDNLTSGQYQKGKRSLVSDDLQNFCCLGVWADQHGCVFQKNDFGEQIPSMPNKKPPPGQDGAALSTSISFGLSLDHQGKLARLNDDYESWSEVLHYIVDELLPEAV